MAKFIITQTDKYLVEADTIEQARENWRNQLLSGITFGEDEYIDGSTTYEYEED
jgi:hypothetical protein